jgi:hypothetical protein
MIQFGKAIYSILTGSTGVTKYVNSNIFPLVIPENTTLPCIVYQKAMQTENSKDGFYLSDFQVSISIISENYAESIDITQEIFNLFNGYRGIVENYEILETILTNTDETFANNAVIQLLIFDCKVKK